MPILETDSSLHSHIFPASFAGHAIEVIQEHIQFYGTEDVEVVAASVFDRKGYTTLGPVVGEERGPYSQGVDTDDVYLHVAVRISPYFREKAQELINALAIDERERLAKEREVMKKRSALLAKRAELDKELAALDAGEDG